MGYNMRYDIWGIPTSSSGNSYRVTMLGKVSMCWKRLIVLLVACISIRCI